MSIDGIKIFALALMMTVAATSCERMLIADDVPATPSHTFDYLWGQLDKQYSLFDVKGTDWDAVYDSLRPRVYNGMSAEALFDVCAAMLRTLNDGHVNLYAGFDVARADSLYYDFYAASGIDLGTVMLHYLGIGYRSAGGVAHQGLCGDSVMYVFYGTFSNTFSPALLRNAIKSYPHAKGVILDVRGNGGGSLKNVSQILTLMPSHGQLLYHSQIKSGPGRNDFTPQVGTYAPIVDTADAYTRPVVVLIDGACFSATSLFAICTQAYDNMVLMGDTTAGGLGLPTMGVLPNGWRYRFPVTRTLALDGRNYENGVPPDIYVPFDRQAAYRYGRDNVIDSACAYILQHAEKGGTGNYQ